MLLGWADGTEAQKEVRPEDYPPPPRHAEVVETFGKVVENMSDLVNVSVRFVGIPDAQTAPQQLERAERVHQVREEIARLPV